ncbi:glycosyl hydrolase [Roseisolibacter sp. H3M3-2]|uniref:WD40/YVTN/BNR-like repeat-containing protein n=1 Tax=Roseisolibacter sp. H3M3-2 TaxID=3031323 RepID=UPI0023DC6D18|nr:glycosyl hydrolase [Roseisolibacter sp. H3M3-2]MDF1505106.1 glycosyl hydrolase [Roseisolibacter sp. H3M3-2]
MRPLSALALSALVVALPDPPARKPSAKAAPVTLDSTLLSGYKWRNIGPDRGGRSIAATGVKGRPNEAYFGATGGGLWKTTDGGENWVPVTDGQITSASIGAVAVSETDPNVVYIGTGETCIRGNIMPGDGVYKSTDAGKTWTHVGFRESHGISKIRVHPRDPNTVFVASFGKYSAPSQERGVFKSTDGGKSWKRVLFRDDKTGAIDIVIDRNDPNVLYAALWEAYRKEYQMSSGGAGSGLFKSTDGGETWTEITRAPGMPQGVVGRIGVAVSGADSKRLWAQVENENGGLFRSDDAGATWQLVNSQRDVRQRAFYYTHVTADPKDREKVYLQNVSMFVSKDGGKTITQVTGQTHGDYHDLWVDPDDPTHLVVANDGGGAVSTTTGGKWTAQDFPTEQFYHAITTAHVPYHVCGSQQDNSTMCTPFDWNAAAFRQRAGQRDTAYTELTAGGVAISYVAGGGEPGYIAPDPRDPDVFYSGTNNGAYVDKFNKRLNTSREVNPYPWFYSGEPASEIRERWQWTFPILFSKADPRLLFVSSQRLWATRDGGKTWLRLSGDLTRHDPATLGRTGGPITGDMNGPEVYATIFSVGPGKKDANIIWTGSDDGLVHVTRDFGKTWTNVTPKDMPDFGRVSQIDASAFDNGRAYVSVRRPLLDDFAPYIFRTTDYGKTWTKIVAGIRPDAYVHAVREDPTRRGMLYAATQHGVYVSYDDGANWQDLSLNLPDVPVADLIVEGNELVLGTHGRGFWVLDDVAALRQAAPEVLAKDAHLFAPPAVVRSGPEVAFSWFAKTAPKAGRLEVVDSAGTVLRSYEPDTARADTGAARPQSRRRRGGVTYLPMGAGLQRLAFDGRAQGIEAFPGMILWGAGTAGPALPPGRYTVRLTLDGKTLTTPLAVKRNPWLTDVTDADLHAQYQFGRRVRDKATEANMAVIQIRRVKAQLDDRYKKAADDAALKAAGEKLRASASAIEEKVYQVRNQSGQDPLNFPIRVNNRLANLLAMAERGDGRPTNNMPEIFGILTTELKGYTDALSVVWRDDLAAVNRELARAKLAPLDPKCANPAGCAAALQ